MWLGDVSMSFLLALILHLLLEAPVTGLVKLLLRPTEKGVYFFPRETTRYKVAKTQTS